MRHVQLCEFYSVALALLFLQINVAVISVFARGFFGRKTSEGRCRPSAGQSMCQCNSRLCRLSAGKRWLTRYEQGLHGQTSGMVQRDAVHG